MHHEAARAANIDRHYDLRNGRKQFIGPSLLVIMRNWAVFNVV